MKNNLIIFLFSLFCLISCQRKYSDIHSQDEVIVEFAARLEDQSPKYRYDHAPTQDNFHNQKMPPGH